MSSSHINRAKLSVVTEKVPIRLHEIRWAGARNLVLRYNEIKDDIRSASLPLETRKLFLNAEMEEGIDEFLKILNNSHAVSLYLQNSDGKECTMMGTRNLFDALIKKFPSMRDDIKSNSKHVHCPDFENGIVKIQSHQEAKLSAAEKEAVKVFLIEEVEREEPADELSFVQSVLMEVEEQQKKRSRVTKYRSTMHVTPVFCICCEQTNSISKHIMSDTRKQMDPTSLEMLLILKLNPDLWNERSVNAVIKRSVPQQTERDISSTPISTLSSSSSSSTAQSFFSTSGNRQQRSERDDDDNEENDEDEDEDENDENDH